jgi:hypothetical protein
VVRAGRQKQSLCQRFSGGVFDQRRAGLRLLHRNAAQGCTAMFDPVQESRSLTALTGQERW